MVPLYGFLQGDTIGLLILVNSSDTVGDLADKLQLAAAVRVRRRANVEVWHKGKQLDSSRTIEQSGILALERFDVVEAGGNGVSKGN